MLDLLKDMKKVAEDAKTVTMQHPKGHTIILVTKKLPQIQKEALKRLPLADGGEIKGIHKTYFEEPETKSQMGESKAGDKVRSSDINKSAQKDAKSEHHKVLGEMKSMPNPKLQGLADGGSVDNSDQKPPVVVNVGQPQSPPVAQAQTPVEVPQPNVQTSNPNVLLPNGSMSAPGAAQTGQEAIQGQQAVDTAKANAMVPIEQARLRAVQLNAQQDQDRINSLSTHADNLAQNMKDIDPDAYRKNMSAPSKVATGLGLFLGGFSVPFGGQNFAGDFLNKQIDRDIQGQIQNQGKQKTIFDAYNQLYGNQVIASNMAKASMADIYKDQIDQVAAKLGTPQALVNAQKLKSDLAITKNKAILDAAGNLKSLPNNPVGGAAPQAEQNIPPGAKNNPNQKLIDAGIVAGTPNAQANIEPQENESTKEPGLPTYHILNPNAQENVANLQYGSPAQRADYTPTLEALTSAQQAEKVLNGPKGNGIGGIYDLMHQMYQNTGEGNPITGLPGHIRRETEGGLGSIPYVGPALAAGLGVIPKSQAQKQYDSNKTVLETDLATALQGKIAPTDINKIVEANLPAYNDKKEDIEGKIQKIVNMVIKASKTTLLEKHKALK